MPANKPQRNGFYWYMQEILPELRREGRSFPNGMKDVVVVALPMWKELPPRAKEKYERIAKERKKQQRKNPDADKTRLDNQGDVIAFRADVDEEETKRRKRDRAAAKNCWPEPTDLSGIKNLPFYFIAFEYLCELEDHEYIPREVALLEYTLQNGISRTYHKFIQNAGIPLGYRFACQSHSDDTHQIPIENFELADDNYRRIWNDIENFVRDSRSEFPPLYCFCGGDSVNWRVTDSCLQWLHRNACTGLPNPLHKVFSLEDMVDDLYSTYLSTEVSIAGLQEMLATSAFDYEANTRCSFHEEKEVKYCALASVKRFAFAISDALSRLFEFELTPNHLPVQDTGNPRFVVIPPSAVHLDAPRVPRPSRSYGSAVENFGNHASNFQSHPELSGPFPSRDIRYGQDTSDGSDAESTRGSTAFSRSHWGAAPASQTSQPPSGSGPWAKTAAIQHQRAPPVMSEEEFPSLGGTSTGSAKYAGRACAPQPNAVPKPDPWKPSQPQPDAPQRLPNTLPVSALRSNPPPITMTTPAADKAMAAGNAKPTLSQAVAAAEKISIPGPPSEPAMPPTAFGRGMRPSNAARSVNSGGFNPGAGRKVNSGAFQPGGVGLDGTQAQRKPTLGEAVQQQSQNSNFSQPAWGSSIGAASSVPMKTSRMNGVQSNQSQPLAGLGRGRGAYNRGGGRQASGGSGMATPPGFGRGQSAQAKMNSQMSSMSLNN